MPSFFHDSFGLHLGRFRWLNDANEASMGFVGGGLFDQKKRGKICLRSIYKVCLVGLNLMGSYRFSHVGSSSYFSLLHSFIRILSCNISLNLPGVFGWSG